MSKKFDMGAYVSDLSLTKAEKPGEATPPPARVKAAPTPERPASSSADTSSEATQARKAARKARAALDERVQIGVYLSGETYREMRAAYLADWSNRRGEADTLYRWLEGAIDGHAARSAVERASRPQEKRASARTGNTRAFKVGSDVYARMQEAIAADEKAGRWSSESAWIVEAIRLATEAARAANGGTLPEPPARLPNRLKRRA